METHHTPGPWTLSSPANSREPSVFGGGHTVAHVSATFIDLDQAEANANLIAAAPDLLQELEGILAFTDGFIHYRTQGRIGRELEKWIEGARVAVAKANGIREDAL